MVFVFNIWVFFSYFVEDGVEQFIGMFYDIVFVYVSYFFMFICMCVFESILDDLFIVRMGNQFKVLNYFSSLLMFNVCIQVFFIFLDYDKVYIRKIVVYIRSKSMVGVYVSEKFQCFMNCYIKIFVFFFLWSGDWIF